MAEKIDAKKIGEIARLNLTDKEAENFQKELDQILTAFDDIKNVDTKDVKPAFQPIGIKNVMRPDKIEPSPGQSLIKIKNKENGFIKGPKVV